KTARRNHKGSSSSAPEDLESEVGAAAALALLCPSKAVSLGALAAVPASGEPSRSPISSIDPSHLSIAVPAESRARIRTPCTSLVRLWPAHQAAPCGEGRCRGTIIASCPAAHAILDIVRCAGRCSHLGYAYSDVPSRLAPSPTSRAVSSAFARPSVSLDH